MIIIEESGIVSKQIPTPLKRLPQLDLILADVKHNWFLSLDIASKLSLGDNLALTLCKEACEGGDGLG